MTIDLHIKNAFIWDGRWTTQRDLYTANGRIVDQPADGAQVVDLDGYTLFPGLVNAHDHLELNHYPRSKFRDVYDNAHQWGEDMNARLETEPYKSLRAYPLRDRLFIGGLKNLLCGATTVAHHGPPHKPMFHRDFPVRVLKNYGWAHSLHFNTEQEVVESYRNTPKDWPWFIHLAEGTDEVAASEYQRLKALDCVGPNTVIVHGVGITGDDAAEIRSDRNFGIGLVSCPTTNQYLLGQTVSQEIVGYFEHIAVGSDSRLTAQGDLLDEIGVLYRAGLEPDYLVWLVTERASLLLCVRGGHLRASDGDPSTFISVKSTGESTKTLCNSRRADLALVVKDGIPRIGDPDVMAKFPQVQTVAATLDGVPKAIHINLARRIHQCALKEPGLAVDALPTKRFWLI